MKFTYRVKHNGVYYNIGEDVPIEGASTPKVEKKVEETEVEVKPEPIAEEIVEDTKKKSTRTRKNASKDN